MIPVSSTAFTAIGSKDEHPTGNRVYSSLQRPHLLRGAEAQWAMTANLAGAGCGLLAFMGWDWHWLLLAGVILGPVQWALRAIGRYDPQFSSVYSRALSHPLVREPFGKI